MRSRGRRSKRGLAIALSMFTLGNLVTAGAPNIAVFLIARVIAGAAAGVYSPLSSAVAAASVSEERRGRALGLVLAGLAMGTVFGVPLGLLLGGLTSWRVSILLITIVGALALIGIFSSWGRELPGVDAPSLVARLRSIGSGPNLMTVTVTLFTGIASWACIPTSLRSWAIPASPPIPRPASGPGAWAEPSASCSSAAWSIGSATRSASPR